MRSATGADAPQYLRPPHGRVGATKQNGIRSSRRRGDCRRDSSPEQVERKRRQHTAWIVAAALRVAAAAVIRVSRVDGIIRPRRAGRIAVGRILVVLAVGCVAKVLGRLLQIAGAHVGRVAGKRLHFCDAASRMRALTEARERDERDQS